MALPWYPGSIPSLPGIGSACLQALRSASQGPGGESCVVMSHQLSVFLDARVLSSG
jgi:hypothetical protein